MDKKVIIRQATIVDFKDIQRLNHKLFVKEYRDYDKTLHTRFPYTKNGKEYFKRRITNHRDGFVAVAEIDSKMIGYLIGGLQARKISRIPARYAELENMIVEQKFRGKKIGSKLITYFFEWCKQKKVDYVKVIASSQNFRAQKLYRKMGFGDYDVELLKKISIK